MTKEENQAAMRAVFSVAEAVRNAGEIAAGVLYATLCQYMTAELFGRVIESMANAKLIERTQSQVLRWVGPVN